MNYSQCYKILGLNEGASLNEVKSAYRKLVLEHHPDKNIPSKDDAKFKIIFEAYHTLRIKNFAYTTTEYSTNYQGSKDHQYEKNDFPHWLNCIFHKIDYMRIKYVRRIFHHYLKYEPTLFEYSDKIEKGIVIMIRRSMTFFYRLTSKSFLETK